jgi:hypothetical protein
MHNCQTKTKTHTHGIRTAMGFLKAIATISVIAFVTGCLEIATSELETLTYQLLRDENTKWQIVGDSLVYPLKDKQLRVLSNGSVDLVAETASGQSLISICVLKADISKLFVQVAGVKHLPEPSVSGSSGIKETLVYEAINEIYQALEAQEATEEPIAIEEEE